MHKKAIAVIALALCFLVTGCATLGRQNNLQVKVSGPAGTKFVCKYQLGDLAGSISTVTTGRESETILDIPLRDGYCDFSKATSAVLKVSLFEGKRERFSFRSSTNTPAFRLIRESGIWRSEVIR
jgi:hypothetical protein